MSASARLSKPLCAAGNSAKSGGRKWPMKSEGRRTGIARAFHESQGTGVLPQRAAHGPITDSALEQASPGDLRLMVPGRGPNIVEAIHVCHGRRTSNHAEFSSMAEHKIHRRSFLETALLGGAGLAITGCQTAITR